MKATERATAVPGFANRELPRRSTARANIGQGVLTGIDRGDRTVVLGLLNEALATHLVCVLRYRRHHFMARGLASTRIAEEFLVHADEELSHADLIADRIVQLGGAPDFSPARLTQRGYAEDVPPASIVDMIKENLVAQRIAIDSYRGLIEHIGEDDPTTRRILQGIVGVEEAHAEELSDLLQGDMHDK